MHYRKIELVRGDGIDLNLELTYPNSDRLIEKLPIAELVAKNNIDVFVQDDLPDPEKRGTLKVFNVRIEVREP